MTGPGTRSAISCSVRTASKRAAGQPSRSAWAVNCGHSEVMVGQAQLGEHVVEGGGVDGLAASCGACLGGAELAGMRKRG